METDINKTSEQQKTNDCPELLLWSPKAILWIGVLFSFLFAGITQAMNFHRLRQERQKRKVLFLSTIGFVLFLIADFKLPDNGLYRLLFFVTNCWISYAISLFHTDQFKCHIKNGGVKASPIKPVLISIAGATIIYGLTFSYFLYEEYTDNEKFNTALTYLNNEEYHKAENAFKLYLEKYPDEIAAYWNLALIYENTGQLQEAISKIEIVLTI